MQHVLISLFNHVCCICIDEFKNTTCRWCDKISNLETYGVAPRGALLRAYFLAAACIFEPSRAAERLAWARAAVLAEAISCYLLSNHDACACNKTTAEWLVREFTNGDDAASYYDYYSPARRDDDGPNSPAWWASSLAGVLRELVDLQASGNAAVAECLRGAVKNPMPLASSFITHMHTTIHT
jgi:hypothetical protein